MDRFIAAVVQMASGPSRPENLERAAAHVREAARRGARLVVLPEVFAWRGPRDEESAHAESIPGPSTDAMAAVARESGVFLVSGSILERDPGGRSFNTACLVAPDGSVVARYRKMHLFDVDLPGRVTVRESDTRAAGREVIVVPTALGAIGLSICYDLRFPELYRRQVRAGAELLAIPSAFTFTTGAAHWEVLCRARAVENQCWVLAANQTGTSPHGFADYGHSLICDPWGTVVAHAGDRPGIALAEIDRGYQSRVRRELPCLEHRRLD
jgi:predicted amidohydrolase